MGLNTLLKHELRLFTAERSLLALTLLLAGVLGFAIWNGLRWDAFQRQAIAAAQQEQAAALARAKTEAEAIKAGKKEVSYWASAVDTRGFVWNHLLTYAIKPPSALAPLAVGQSDVLPYLVKVSTNREASLAGDYEHVNARKLLLGPFDLAFAITHLLPVFVLMLCYDVLAREKEAGILGLIAAQPIALTRLVWVKIGFRLFFVLAIVMLLSAAALGLSGAGPGDTGNAAPLLGWFGVVVAYTLFWFVLGTFVISRGWRSATNALALAAVWLFVVVLIPAGVSTYTAAAHPLPSRIEYIKTLRDTNEATRKAKDQLSESFFVDHLAAERRCPRERRPLHRRPRAGPSIERNRSHLHRAIGAAAGFGRTPQVHLARIARP